MVDAALDKLFGALDTKGGKVLDAEMMRFLGKAILGTMPSAEAAKYVDQEGRERGRGDFVSSAPGYIYVSALSHKVCSYLMGYKMFSSSIFLLY